MTSFPSWWRPADPEPEPVAEAGIWEELKAVLDMQQFKPARAGGIVVGELTDRSGHHYILKNRSSRSYLRLSPEEYWVWERLDGRTSVQRLVLAYFMQYRAFAYPLIVALLERLRQADMLSETPRRMYAEISAAIQKQSLLYKLSWPAHAFFNKEFAIRNLDEHIGRIYRYGGWLLFTLPLQVGFALLTLIGLALFVLLARDPQYNLLSLNTAIQLGLLAYIPFVVHEFGHAITAKHYGCEVDRGGLKMEYGLPAAFVDTTDVWMFDKRTRLAVTWAGPYTGYLLGGACAILVYFSPGMPPATAVLLLHIALAGIFTTTLNLLPLLKMDGYYLLSDALEIPRLRERSLEFITRSLGHKIRSPKEWTREEKVFLVYGITAVLSTVYFIWASISFWDSQASRSASELLNLSADIGAQLANIGIILLAASTIVYTLVLLASNAGRAMHWLQTRGVLSTRWRAAAVILFGAAALTVLPHIFLPTLASGVILVLGMAAFITAAWRGLVLFQRMHGSVHAGMWLWAAAGALIGLGGFAGQVNPAWAQSSLAAQAAGMLIFLGLFLFAGRLLSGLQGSWRAISLLLIALGLGAWTASMVVPAEMRTLAGALILGGTLHWDARPGVSAKPADLKTGGSTREKMTRAVREISAVILAEVRLDFGLKTKKRIESGVYKPAGSRIDQVEFNSTMTSMTPSDYGSVMALALERLLASVTRAGGRTYAWRMLAFGYDRLNWELKEILEDHILKYVTYARGLSSALEQDRNDFADMIRSVPIFAGISQTDTDLLGKRFQPIHFIRGEDIVRAGETGDTFYILRAGRVDVLSADGEKLNTLKRGDYFGEGSLLTDQKRSATVRAVTPVEVLALKKSDFDRLIRDQFSFDEQARAEFQRLGVLRQIPLFEHFDGRELRQVSRKLETITCQAGETIFKQGEPGDSLYIIQSGAVSVQIDAVERARLGTGEYFGEIALLMDTPRTATVVARQPTTLLRLSGEEFAALIKDSTAMKQAIERTSSRRVLSNAYWVRGDQLAELPA
jgi:CRP-like cAMP-binding protein